MAGDQELVRAGQTGAEMTESLNEAPLVKKAPGFDGIIYQRIFDRHGADLARIAFFAAITRDSQTHSSWPAGCTGRCMKPNLTATRPPFMGDTGTVFSR